MTGVAGSTVTATSPQASRERQVAAVEPVPANSGLPAWTWTATDGRAKIPAAGRVSDDL